MKKLQVQASLNVNYPLSLRLSLTILFLSWSDLISQKRTREALITQGSICLRQHVSPSRINRNFSPELIHQHGNDKRHQPQDGEDSGNHRLW